MVQKVIHPLLEIHVCSLAAPHQGVDDGSIFSSVVIAAEEIVLASDCHGAHTVLYQVRVWEIPSVHRIPHQLARVVQEVADGFSYGTLRKHISLFTDTPLLKSAYDRIGKPLPQLHALEGIHMLVVCHALSTSYSMPIWVKAYSALALSWDKALSKYLRVCTQHPNVVMPSCFSKMLYPA